MYSLKAAFMLKTHRLVWKNANSSSCPMHACTHTDTLKIMSHIFKIKHHKPSQELWLRFILPSGREKASGMSQILFPEGPSAVRLACLLTLLVSTEHQDVVDTG